jgi:DNA polymerase family A
MPRSRLAAASLYIDFEYRLDGAQLILCCALVVLPDGRELRHTIDFRDFALGRSQLAALYHQYRDATWFSYAALAELKAFETAGFDVRGMNWVCLLAEATQIVGSHDRYYLHKSRKLLDVLAKFGITTPTDAALKDKMRDLILSSDEYTDEEWDDIVSYCWEDILGLPSLWRSIQEVHAGFTERDEEGRQTPKRYNLTTAQFHGDYLVALAHLESHSRGFPIDVALLDQIYDNLPLIRRRLAEEANERYGGKVFVFDKLKDRFIFKEANLDAFLKDMAAKGIPIDWQRTRTGKLKLEGDYLEALAKEYPIFKPLASTRSILQQLKHTDLRSYLKDGFIKGVSLPFWTVTSRNQPLAARGFILNLPSWMRSLVRPQPNHCILTGDWSQEEIVLAASLSGDDNLAAALATGDVYMAIGKLSNLIPADGTKDSHAPQRALCKVLQLGIGYGMGLASLIMHIYLEMLDQGHAVSLDEVKETATYLMQWHRRAFAQFWDWKNRKIRCAMEDGFVITPDNWSMFTGWHTRETTIGNFPMQGGGSTILREAVKLLAQENDIEFVCSHHDALYAYCHMDDRVSQRACLRRCMTEAVDLVMRHTPMPLKIKIDGLDDDRKLITHATGYADGRGAKTLAHVMSIISATTHQSDIAS